MKCPKCGVEIDTESTKCPSCGRELDKRSRRGRILALVFGIVALIVSILWVIASVLLIVWVSGPKDPDGYRVSETSSMTVDSHAVVVDLVELNMDEGILGWFETEDAVVVRLKGIGNASTKELFVGVAREDDAMAYLGDVHYDFAINYYWRVSPGNVTLKIAETMPHRGGAPSEPPTNQTFWLASDHGHPVATVEWVPETGFFWIVYMNADGSSGVEASIELGAKFPILTWLPVVLLVIGVIIGVGGGLLIHFGYLKRR